jgi:dephospho-CoA kinase
MQPPNRTSYAVALTGGVASGKTTVARAFEEHGVAVHDADIAAREVVLPGLPAHREIVAAFGDDVVQPDGRLDRRALRQRIFDDTAARKRLEAIIHPRVAQWFTARVAHERGAYCILAIPLLAETWPAYAWVDRVAVVDVDEATQLRRLVHRDGITEALARDMIASQATREQRRAIADDLIDNSGTPEAARARVDALHRRYLELAAAKR